MHTPWGSTCTSLNKHPLSTASSLRPSLRAGDPTPLHALPVSGGPLDIHVDPRDDAEQHRWHAYARRMRCGVFDAALAQRRQRDVLDTVSHLVSTPPQARPQQVPTNPSAGFPARPRHRRSQCQHHCLPVRLLRCPTLCHRSRCTRVLSGLRWSQAAHWSRRSFRRLAFWLIRAANSCATALRGWHSVLVPRAS